MQLIFVFALLSSAVALPTIPAVAENLIDSSSPVVAKAIGGNSGHAFGALVDQGIPAAGKQQDAFQYGNTNANDNFGNTNANDNFGNTNANDNFGNTNDNFGVESANTYGAPQATFDAPTSFGDQSMQPNANSPSQYDAFNPGQSNAGAPQATFDAQPNANSPSQYDAFNPVQSNAGSAVNTPVAVNPIYYKVDSLEDDDDHVFFKSGSPQVPTSVVATLFKSNTQKPIYFADDSLEAQDIPLFYKAGSHQVPTQAQATLYNSNVQKSMFYGIGSMEDDDDLYYRSGQVPQYHTALDVSQVNFQNARSAGHPEQIVVPSDSGEVEAYRLVGLAPSNAVRLGSFTPTAYSANMGQQVPVYKEIDDDDFYGLPGTQNMNAMPSMYSALAGSGQPFHVKAETTMSGNSVVLLLD